MKLSDLFGKNLQTQKVVAWRGTGYFGDTTITSSPALLTGYYVTSTYTGTNSQASYNVKSGGVTIFSTVGGNGFSGGDQMTYPVDCPSGLVASITNISSALNPILIVFYKTI